jgi:energy-coupling factor transporter ATP-binding protein EcfA2
MSTDTDLTTQIIADLKTQSYFDLADNGAKTRIRNALALKYEVDAVWIKDVVINGYGKQGRRIENSKVAEIFAVPEKINSIRKLSEDPAEGYVSFENIAGEVYFVSSAPTQVGTGLMKAMNAMKSGAIRGLVIINNGNDGPLNISSFNELKVPLEKLGILAAAVHSEGISHQVETLDLKSQSTKLTKLALSNISCPLIAKPFLILTGPSGTGKTRGAVELAKLVCGESCHELVAVGADWTDNRHVLGYLNPLEPGVLNEQSCPIYETTPILDLILHANTNSDQSHVLILDEMNLSHVERYFADFLSAMELEDKTEALKLHAAGTAVTRSGKEVPGRIDFPTNLFVIGTVNIDETTYMFSPKVLDRANVIEIHADPTALENFLKGSATAGGGPEAKDYGISFLEAAKVIQAKDPVVHPQVPLLPPTVRDAATIHLMALYRIMKRGRGEYGFRTGKEVMAYLRTAHFLAGPEEAGRTAWATGENWHDALDAQILQKILPKLHGSRSRLAPLLGALATYCAGGREEEAMDHFPKEGAAPKRNLAIASTSAKRSDEDTSDKPDPKFKKSYQKLCRMIDVLVEEQFVSFIC